MQLFGKTAGFRNLLSHAAAVALGVLVLLAAQRWPDADCNDAYDLLNPQVRCSELHQGEWDYEPLRDQLLVKKNDWKNDGTLSQLSVYFRDLRHGPRFGIGEWDKFQPASLRKVPVMIAILHIADYDRSFLDKTLSFTGALRMNQNIEHADETLQPNVPYPIRELLKKMIVYSDNYSYTLLTNELNVTPPIVSYYTFRDLGVLRMMMDPKGDFISIQSYANLFSVLYNTGYLSREMSQYGLGLLTQATFKDGLVAGVPEGVRVAHKFGQRFAEDGTDEGQLHDCGVVYHPKMPYVLCVMTSGTDAGRQKAAVADISRTVYEAVSTLTLNN